jgi:molecular chaperone DnaK
VPQIEVTFEVDHNGILHVSARDLATGKEQKIRIEASSGLTQAEIERMRKEAEAHAAEDRRRRELAETRNQADNLIYHIEKVLREHGSKLSSADKAAVESAIARLKEKMKGDDITAIRQAIAELEQASHAMSQHLYRQAAGAGTTTSGDGSRQTGGPSEGVIDADFEVKK